MGETERTVSHCTAVSVKITSPAQQPELPFSSGVSMGSKQEHRGWLQVQGWDLTGLRDMCSGPAHVTAMLQLGGIWAFRNGTLEGKDRPLCKRAAGMHGLCLGMEDELAESLQIRISGQTNRGDMILQGSALDLLTRKNKLMPSSNSWKNPQIYRS